MAASETLGSVASSMAVRSLREMPAIRLRTRTHCEPGSVGTAIRCNRNGANKP